MANITTNDVKNVVDFIKIHTTINGDLPITDNIINNYDNTYVFENFKQMYGGECANKIDDIRIMYVDYVGGGGPPLALIAKMGKGAKFAKGVKGAKGAKFAKGTKRAKTSKGAKTPKTSKNPKKKKYKLKNNKNNNKSPSNGDDDSEVRHSKSNFKKEHKRRERQSCEVNFGCSCPN